MKNGFTLIEVIVTVCVIFLISITGFITFNKVLNNSKDKDYNRITKEFETAAEVWLEKKEDEVLTLSDESTIKKSVLKQNLYNVEGTFFKLTLEELLKNNLIDENIINPKTNDEFDYEKSYVKLSYDEAVVDGKDNKGLLAVYMEPAAPGIYLLNETFLIENYKELKDSEEEFDPFKNIKIINVDGLNISPQDVEEPDEVQCNYTEEKEEKYNNAEEFSIDCSYTYTSEEKEKEKTVSYDVKYKSIIEGDYYYIPISRTYTVDLPRTFKFKAVGAKGKNNGVSQSKGATLETEIKLNMGDTIKIEVGGQETKFGGGQDGDGYFINNGGDSTRVYVNGKLAFAAAGGGGGPITEKVDTDVLEVSDMSQFSSSPAGGIGERGTTLLDEVSPTKDGESGKYGGGSGAGNTYIKCIRVSVVKDLNNCSLYRACPRCGCRTYRYCRLEEFGCEQYNRCRVASCGCENYKTSGTKRICIRYKMCEKSSCGCAIYNKKRDSACGCQRYINCRKCGCLVKKSTFYTCSSSNNECLDVTGYYKKCISTNRLSNSGKPGRSFINTNIVTSSNTVGSIGTYDCSCNTQGNNGFLKITQKSNNTK